MKANDCNFYIGATLRKPGTPNKRARKSDCLFTQYLWCDYDDGEADESAMTVPFVPPSYYVVTNKIPHPHVHLCRRAQLGSEATAQPKFERQKARIIVATGGNNSKRPVFPAL